MSTEERLDLLVGSVSDGLDVDWNAAGFAGDDTGWPHAHALRDVARIAEFNRGLQRSPLPGERTAPSGPQTERWGDLTLLELIGLEAGGEVWRAWDQRLLREVALKFLRPHGTIPLDPNSPALLNEARALARVHHPNVVAVYGIAEHDDRMGMWMEYLRGVTLAGEIELRGALPPREVARIGLELCRALDAVHREGLVHGDVKPANIVLESGGRIVLADFGLGRRPALTGSDQLQPTGTPLFMSSALLSGKPATPRSDFYALGVTLRWALTGGPPFRARTLSELKDEAAAGPSMPLADEIPGAPRKLVTAIEVAMAPEPEARFGGAGQMAAALQSVIEDLDGGSSPRRRPTRGMVMAAVVLVALVAAMGPRLLRPSIAMYEVDATLVRRSTGGLHRLGTGDRVSPGDQLSLKFRATSPVWVYVLNEDERGETFLLFPQPRFDVSNPIPGDSTIVLPGAIGGVENAWEVTSRGGREHFLVVASRKPVADIERDLKRLPEAKPGRPILYASVDTSTVERLRGVGGVAPLPAGTSPPGGSAFESFQVLAGRERVVQDIWVRKITLENPLE
jgi:serine/threonine protein kinase